MKKLLLLLLVLMMVPPLGAMAESNAAEPIILHGEHALVTAVAQDDESTRQHGTSLRTCYEVTVPVHLPVTLRIQHADETVTEFAIRPAVMQITYFMETSFDGTRLYGGGVDHCNYPKLSLLGVPLYPGGPNLSHGLVPNQLAYDVTFEIIDQPRWDGTGTRDGGQSITIKMTGGKIRVTYPGVITMDEYGCLISAEMVTQYVTSGYAQQFYANAPEYTGKTHLPTFEEWMGVPSVPR